MHRFTSSARSVMPQSVPKLNCPLLERYRDVTAVLFQAFYAEQIEAWVKEW